MIDNAIGENVKDPKVKDWILPDFTTTTPEDTTVAAVLRVLLRLLRLWGPGSVPCAAPSAHTHHHGGARKRGDKVVELLGSYAWFSRTVHN